MLNPRQLQMSIILSVLGMQMPDFVFFYTRYKNVGKNSEKSKILSEKIVKFGLIFSETTSICPWVRFSVV